MFEVVLTLWTPVERSDDDHVRLMVEDHGRGIPEEEIAHIFDPFYRGTALDQTEGYGIGLSNDKVIITNHGWAIDASSRPGEGTKFSIRIPLGDGT